MAEGDRGTNLADRSGGIACAAPGTSTDVAGFVRDTAFGDLPADVVAQGERCLLDLIGVAAAASRTPAAAIAVA